MTDNEIILSMECCNSVFSEHRCKDCPMQGNFRCSFFAIKNGIELINRQNKEIERLEKENKDKERAYTDEYCLRKEWQSKCRDLLEEKQTAKSEAIKEFAEKLRKRFYFINGHCGVDIPQIDNLVKEMTEVKS